MISFITGTVSELLEDILILECGGIGYQIQIPVSFAETLHIGEKCKVYTYLQVREDALCLFGFESRDDLDMFRLLLGVNGIGPKAAIGILSVITPDDLRFAVLADDAKTISKAPGVGLKTAKKVILELKDKLKLEDAIEIKEKHSRQSPENSPARDSGDEVLEALTSLGYSAAEAMKAIRLVEHADEMDTEVLLKAALKNLAIF